MRLLPMDGMQSLKFGDHGPEFLRQRDGTMTVPQAYARAAIREGVAVPANAAGPTAHLPGGFVCPTCGRRNYFRACGRCGTEA